MSYHKRRIENLLLKSLSIFPAVVLTGPRQAGKSTLLKHLFRENWTYLSFDERALALRAKEDPDLFIRDLRANVILDEVQKVPELFHSIKHAIDQKSPYQFILSGSANFLLMSQVTETLAGRAGIAELLPFDYLEIKQLKRDGILNRLVAGSSMESFLEECQKSHPPKMGPLEDIIFQGGFPALLALQDREDQALWFENYRTTYIERDLRDLAHVANIGDFQKLYEMLAYQSGSLLDYSNLGRDLGISSMTVKKYFQILETSYQYFLLRPYFKNIGKRLIKSPKVFAMDTGLACFLMKYQNPQTALNGGNWGNLLETWVISELYKQRMAMPVKPHFYFWRTSNGAEIDLLIESGETLIPIEIKNAVQHSPQWTKGLSSLLESPLKKKIPFGIVLYRGENVYRIHEKIVALPLPYLFAQ